MFTRRGRDTATQEPAEAAPPVAPRKGRPTPKRAEAERERRERIKPTKDPRQKRIQDRKKRAEATKLYREGLNTGDERYLPKRDKGPIRKFVRDYVDGRLTAAEFFMPIALASLVFMVIGAAGLGGSLSTIMIMIVLFDSMVMTVQLRRALGRKFPEESHRGATGYALMRALTWRSLRTPKPQVPRGYRP